MFFVNVPLTAVAFAAAWRLLAPDPEPRGGNFDITGGLLATASANLFVFALVNGPDQGWNRTFTTYLQQARDHTPLIAGLMFLPLTIVAMGASLRLTPALLARWGLRATLSAGLAVSGVGIALLTLGMGTHSSLWALGPGLIIWGLGGGVTFPAMFTAAAVGIPGHQQGTASGVANTARQIGQAVGVAAVVAVATTRAAVHTTTAIDGLRTAGLVVGAATVAAAAAIVGLPRAGASDSVASARRS